MTASKTPREHCFTGVSICSSRGAVRGSPRLPHHSQHALQHVTPSRSPQEAGCNTCWSQSKFVLPSLFNPLKNCLSSTNCGRRGLRNLANHEIYEKWNFSQKTDGNNFLKMLNPRFCHLQQGTSCLDVLNWHFSS